MRAIHRVTFALVLGAAIQCAAYAQSPEYRTPQGPPSTYDPNYRDRDDRYDDRDDRYDDRDYDDDRDDRGYNDRYSPRDEVGFFYDELSPYGDWVMSRAYGWAWFPRNVHPYWRPYRDGRWVNTDYGWTWASNEPFGWATYHYGRWAWDQRFGWLWVPGTIWGPAWVSWQYGGGYVGWAPLPPSVGFEIGIGIRLGGFDLNIGIQPNTYSFVPERSFLESRLSGFVIPTARNVTIIHNTRNITNYGYVGNRVVNRGVEVRRIEQVTGRRARPLRVGEARSRTRTEVGGAEVRIYRPRRQQLDTVRVGPRANEGMPSEPAPGRDRNRPAPAPGRREAPESQVAPRANRPPLADPVQVDRQERRGKQELEKYQAEEKRKLEKLQEQERAQTRERTERGQVEERHKNEREAQLEEQQAAARQLEARQKARREAEVQNPPGGGKSQGGVRPNGRQQDPQPEKKNKPGKGPKPEGKPHGEEAKPEGPPPGRVLSIDKT